MAKKEIDMKNRQQNISYIVHLRNMDNAKIYSKSSTRVPIFVLPNTVRGMCLMIHPVKSVMGSERSVIRNQ